MDDFVGVSSCRADVVFSVVYRVFKKSSPNGKVSKRQNTCQRSKVRQNTPNVARVKCLIKFNYVIRFKGQTKCTGVTRGQRSYKIHKRSLRVKRRAEYTKVTGGGLKVGSNTTKSPKLKVGQTTPRSQSDKWSNKLHQSHPESKAKYTMGQGQTKDTKVTRVKRSDKIRHKVRQNGVKSNIRQNTKCENTKMSQADERT